MEGVTSPLVAEVLVLLMAAILSAAALIFAKRLTPQIGVLLLALALIAALLVSLRHRGLLGL